LARTQETWPCSNMSNCDNLSGILVIIDLIRKKRSNGLYATNLQKT
jgi:hypothetical protein